MRSEPGANKVGAIEASHLDLARRYVAGGCSIIPVKTDGSKGPALSWKEFQTRRATDTELVAWFATRQYGIAIVCGTVSGHMEIIDFDAPGFFESWSALVEELIPGLVARLPIVRTPSGGHHVYTRAPVAADGNSKLAWISRPNAGGGSSAEKKNIAIETRGEGGYAIAPGSPPEVHPERALYVRESGPDITATPVLTEAERAILLDAARALDQCPKEERAPEEHESKSTPEATADPRGGTTTGLRPGDDWNRRASWSEILEPRGWTHVGGSPTKTRWLRPGKTGPGLSATTGYCRGRGGDELLYVFSTNAAPFEAGRAYSKFAAHAILNHNGDFRNAARELRARGYGDFATVAEAVGEDAKKKIESLIEDLRLKPDLEKLFNSAHLFLALDAAATALCKYHLREIFGRKLNLKDFDRLVNDARREQREARDQCADDESHRSNQPRIVFNGRQLREVTEDAAKALHRGNTPAPTLFSRGGEIVQERVDERGEISIQICDEPSMVGRLSQVADWFITSKNGKYCSGFPPREVARVLLRTRGAGFPPLACITTMPVFRSDGTIVTQEGYDPSTCVLYRPDRNFCLPSIPRDPKPDDLAKARFLLETELLGGFPFVSPADRSNAIALAITPILRTCFTGPSPLCAIDAPKQGTGKSLLAKTLGYVGTGAYPHFRPMPGDDEEVRKAITSVLLRGVPIVVFDNVEFPVAAPSLAMALTSEVWSDRQLGQNRELTLPVLIQWVITGNNLSLQGDLPRRTYVVRLDAKMSRPWLGRKFEHPNLLRWVREEHGTILSALLTLCQAWFAARCPLAKGSTVLGSFESWSETIGGVLANAGIQDFLGNIEELYGRSSHEENDWERFLRAWAGEFGARWVTAQQLAEFFSKPEYIAQLPDTLQAAATSESKNLARAIGNTLRRRVGTRYGKEELFVERREDPAANLSQWCVVRGRDGERANSQSQADIDARETHIL